MRADVAVGADQHARVAEEAPHAADRLRPIVGEAVNSALWRSGNYRILDLPGWSWTRLNCAVVLTTTTGVGKYGASLSVTQIGPAPGRRRRAGR